MERGLVGVLSICFVLSTLLAAIFFGITAPEKVTLIRLSAFEGPLEKVRPYSIELLVREPIDELRLEFSYLIRVNEGTHDMLSKVIDPGEAMDSSGESLSSIPKVQRILEMEEPFSQRPGYRFFKDTAQYEDKFREVEYELAVLDIRDFLKYLPPSAGPEAYGAYMVFAVLIHEENVSYYQGAFDYYLDRLNSMGEFSYEVNDESVLFENPRVIVPRSTDYTHIREAPPDGTVIFNDLKAEDTVRVFFNTRHLAGPGVLIVRVWVDGQVQDNYFSFAGWPETEY